jgi:hypothetical protein
MRKEYHTIDGHHDDMSWLFRQDLDVKAQRVTAVRDTTQARADIKRKTRQEAEAEAEATVERREAHRARFAAKMLERVP